MTIMDVMLIVFLQIDLLAEISQPPRILSDVDGALKAKQIKAEFDEYLKVVGSIGPGLFSYITTNLF